MKLDWMDQFVDPYLQKPAGRGIFLSGVVLGFIASCQQGRGGNINDAPLFKKLPFGKLQNRDIKRHLAEVPVMLKAYEIPYAGKIRELSGAAGELLMQGKDEMNVDGNFIFSMAFLNAWKYMAQIFELQFGKTTDEQTVEEIE